MRKLLYGVVALLVFVSFASAALVDGLQGYWQFNGDGSDSSGNSNDLTVTAKYSGGLLGQAMNLGGSTSTYATRSSDDDAFDFGSSDFAIQVWINWNTTAGEQVIIEKFSGQNGPGWTLTKVNESTIQFYCGSAYEISTTIAANTWHQIIVSRSGTSLSIYFDNSNLLTTTIGSLTISDTTMPVLFGKRNENDGRGFATSGMFDETAIWNRALTASEITSLYNNGTGMILPEPATIALLCLGSLVFIRKTK